MSGREIIAAFAKICTKRINTLCGQNVHLRAASQNCGKRLLISSCPSAWNNSAHTVGGFFHAVWYLGIFRKSVEKIHVSLKSDKNEGHFTYRPKDIFIISLSLLLIMRNVSGRSCRENQNTFYFQLLFLSFENRAVYEIMWKNTVERGRPQMTIRPMCIACWIPKSANTHSEYVTVIVFPIEQCLHERVWMLRCM